MFFSDSGIASYCNITQSIINKNIMCTQLQHAYTYLRVSTSIICLALICRRIYTVATATLMHGWPPITHPWKLLSSKMWYCVVG
jgi:hypothetical protein